MKVPRLLGAALAAFLALAGMSPVTAQEEQGDQRDATKEAGQPAHPTSQPKHRKPPQKPAKKLSPVQRARRDFGRAVAFTDPIRRRTKLRQLDAALANLVEQARGDAALEVKLLALQVRVQAELKDFSRARRTIRKLHSLVKERRGPEEFDAWLSKAVFALRGRRTFELAIAHLSESIKADPESKSSALHSLLIGDILLQKWHPDGPFDRAIRQYASTAERYRALHSDIADEARLRQGTTLWRNGQPNEARQVFAALYASARANNPTIAERAEHYEELLANGNPIGRRAGGQEKRRNDEREDSP